MIIYSVQPPEVIWATPDPSPTETLDLGGQRHLVVERTANGHRRVVRMHSTEPRDYLEPSWQPGQKC